MKRKSAMQTFGKLACVVSAVTWAFLGASEHVCAQQSAAKPATAASTVTKTFDTPQQAGDALVDAAGKFDVGALEEIFGPDGDDIVLSGEYPQDRQRALDFAAEAREKKSVSVDPKTGSRAGVSVYYPLAKRW